MVTRTDLVRSHFFCDDSLISDQGWKKGRWEKWRDAPVDGYGYPIVRVRKVCRRVNYEGWRKRERERVCVCMRACACVYTIDRTRAVNLVIKDPFCYRFNRIMLSRTDRKFGGMATHTSVSVLLKFHAACVGVASLPLFLLSPSPSPCRPCTDRRPPYLRHSPSAAHRPPQTIFTRGHHLAACEIHLGKCSRYIANSKLSKLARPHTLPWRIHRIKS